MRSFILTLRLLLNLLNLFLLEKAAYEIRYEAANRPGWIGIPLNGLHGIASGLLGGETGNA